MTGNMRRLGRAAASLFGLGALVGGVPALLITLVGWPLPHGVPSLDDIRTAVGDGWRPDERFMFGLLALVVWVVWAQLVRHVLSQLRWQLRAQRAAAATGDLAPAPQAVFVPGGRRTLSQRIAGWLVGGLMIAAPLAPGAAMASPAPRIPVVLSVTNAMADALVSPPGAPAALSTTAVEARAPRYVVHTWEERRDCLWNIAERYLGDPFRWTEIRDLNADRVQPDGRRLGENPSSWVYPGWELFLPPDAVGADVVPAQSVVAPAAPSPAGAPAAPVGSTASAPTTAPAAAPTAPTSTAAPSTTAPTPTTAAPATSTSSPTTTRAAAGVTPAPPASTAPASPTSAPARSTGNGSVVSVNPWATRAAMAGALGLPIFALAGWLTRLRRGRVAQASRARPGRDVVRTEPAVEPLERQARAIAADQAEEWIDAALRALTAALADAAFETSPRLRCVRAGDMGLEVLLADPFPLAPEGWEAADGGHVWRVPDDVDLAELERRGAEQPVAAPALVSLGATPEGPILADLEAFGALSVEGDAERVRAFLSGAALELASASWAQGVDLRVYGLDGFARLEGVVVDGEELLREVRSMAELVTEGLIADGLDADASALTARVGGPAGPQPWYPMVVLVGPDADRDVAARLVEVGTASTGVAVAGAGPFDAAEWQLVVGTEGTAVLKPLGLDVRMAGVAEVASSAGSDVFAGGAGEEPAAAAVATNGHRPGEVLADADTDPPASGEQPAAAPHDSLVVVDQGGLDQGAITTAVNALAAVDEMDDVAAPIPFAPQSRPGRSKLRRPQDCEVWVSILRRNPEVTGWAKEPRGRRRLVEVLVYLAIYGQQRPIPAGELRTHCWPPQLAPTGPGERERLQEVTVDTFHQAMSRLRKQLGEGAMGWHLPLAVDGAYVPGAGVGCDWTLFQALAALAADAAARHETAKAIRLYREALELVEGEPFADVPPGSHVWVETEHLVTDIRLAVSRTASQLAEVAMPSDPETALWATQRGLLLLPTQLDLFDTWMTAAAELGDAGGIDQGLQAKTWAYGQLDPDAGVPPETMELYRHLMAKVNGRDRVGQSQRG